MLRLGMANAVPNAPRISWQEFMALDWPHEWVEGVAYAMGATTPRHAQLCARLAQQLPARGDCSAYAAGLVVYVAELDRGFLPDLVVICGAPEEAPGKPGAVTNPSIVFEVLSASTQSYDRTTKFDAYQRLPSLQAYVLLYQQGAKAEVFRPGDVAWVAEEYDGGVVELPGNVRLDLDAL
jgi:Uma2 family endonuclease